MGALILAVGVICLYKVWWRVSLQLSPDSNVAVHVALVLISAALIWIGMALIGHALFLVRKHLIVTP
jgi:hypothetical protein